VDRDDGVSDAIEQFRAAAGPQGMRHDIVLRGGILAGLELVDPGIAYMASARPAAMRVV
jgi:hypothetical protein